MKTSNSESESLWTKAPVANLVRYEPSGIYFARAKVRGNQRGDGNALGFHLLLNGTDKNPKFAHFWPPLSQETPFPCAPIVRWIPTAISLSTGCCQIRAAFPGSTVMHERPSQVENTSVEEHKIKPYEMRNLKKHQCILVHCEHGFKRAALPPLEPDGEISSWYKRNWF